MKLYNIIIEDRHNDVEVRSFKDRETAILIAKQIAKSLNRHIEYLKEEVVEGYEFFMTYSCEDDHVSVMRTILEDSEELEET